MVDKIFLTILLILVFSLAAWGQAANDPATATAPTTTNAVPANSDSIIKKDLEVAIGITQIE